MSNSGFPARAVSTVVLALLVGVVLFGSNAAPAQTTISTGSIHGTVVDPSNAVVSGAKVTITNRGSQYLTLADSDFSLTAEGQQPLSPLAVVPTLTQELQPGASLSLVLTFANPGGHTAVLRVLDITTDLYY